MQELNDLERTLTTDLRRLSEQVPDPAAEPGADLDRARRAGRNSRLRLGAVGALGIAAVVTAGVFAVPVIAGPTPGLTAHPAATPSVSLHPSELGKDAEALCRGRSMPTVQYIELGQMSRYFDEGLPVLEPIGAVLREHLDPELHYLHDQVVNQQRTCTGQPGVWSLGTRLAWSTADPGVAGAVGGQLRVAVGTDAAALDLLIKCGDEWQCREIDASDLEGVESARIATFDSGFAAIVERTNGETVLLVADQDYGLYEYPAEDFPFDVDDLVEAAADSRITLNR